MAQMYPCWEKSAIPPMSRSICMSSLKTSRTHLLSRPSNNNAVNTKCMQSDPFPEDTMKSSTILPLSLIPMAFFSNNSTSYTSSTSTSQGKSLTRSQKLSPKATRCVFSAQNTARWDLPFATTSDSLNLDF